MLLDLLKEFGLELMRSLFLERLCSRIKEGVIERVRRRRGRELDVKSRVHLRYRERLLHRLTTKADKNL